MGEQTPTDENLEKVRKMQVLTKLLERILEMGWETITRQMKIWEKVRKMQVLIKLLRRNLEMGLETKPRQMKIWEKFRKM